MRDRILDLLTKILGPFLMWISKVHFPWSRKKMDGADYYEIRDYIKVGDIILTTTLGEATNIINPSKWKHGKLYVGKLDLDSDVRYVIEAIGQGVVKNNLVDAIMKTDELVVIRVRDHLKFTDADVQKIIDRAVSMLGNKYDISFQKGNKAQYCFELCVESINAARPDMIFNTKKIIGREAYTSDTFLKDEHQFQVIKFYHSGKDKK